MLLEHKGAHCRLERYIWLRSSIKNHLLEGESENSGIQELCAWRGFQRVGFRICLRSVLSSLRRFPHPLCGVYTEKT